MRKTTLLTLVLCLATVMTMAGQGGSPVITASGDMLDFGAVEVGYPVTATLTVGGQNLTGDIALATQARSVNYFKVSPTTISPEQAAAGVNVTVTYSPGSAYWHEASLVLSSPGAQEVVIPITASPYFPENNWSGGAPVRFTAWVGQSVKADGIVRFADYDVPIDPTQPMITGGAAASTVGVFPGLDGAGAYSVTVEGCSSFSARIVKSSALTNLCTVRVTYHPTSLPVDGTDRATLKVTCSKAGVPVVTIPLEGTAAIKTCDPVALPVEPAHTTETSLSATWKMDCYAQGVKDFVLECAPAGSDFEVWNPDYQIFTYLTPSECPYNGRFISLGSATGNLYSYTINGLSPDVIYSFRVKARFIDDTWSEWSNVQTVVLGDSQPAGDIDGDGHLTVGDVSLMIDQLLGN